LQENYQKLAADSEKLKQILTDGNQRAQKIASQTLEAAKKAMGMA